MLQHPPTSNHLNGRSCRYLRVVTCMVLLGMGLLVLSASMYDVVYSEWSEARDGNVEENSAEWDDWKFNWFHSFHHSSEAQTHCIEHDFAIWSCDAHTTILAYRPPKYLLNLALKLDC